MSNNLFVRLKQILPPAPVLVGLVTEHHAEDDTSTVVLPTNEGRIEYAAGVAVGSTIRARGTTVAIGDKAFVRNGVIETRAPSEDAIEIEIGRVVPPMTPLAFDGPIADQGATEGTAFTPLDVSAEWSGGSGALTFSVAAGTLPAGLTLSSAGVLSGTPTTEALTTGLKLRATDTAGYRADSNEFSFDVTAAAPTAARWVSVASTSQRVWYSDDRGATWVDTGYSFPGAMQVAWGGGTFVAFSSGAFAADFYTSPDGVTWTLRTAPVSTLRYGVAWNGSIFVAATLPATYLGPHVLTSPDGITWTAMTLAGVITGEPTQRNICWATDRFVLSQGTPGSGGNTNGATSPDGVTWTPCEQPDHPSSFNYAAGAIKVGSTYSVLPGVSNNKIYTTADFATFTQFTLSAGTVHIVTSTGSPAASNGSAWVIASSNGLRSTTDGLAFTLRRSGAHGSVYWDGVGFVADGGGVIATSPDGVTWSVVTPPFTVSRMAVAHWAP